MNKLFYLVVLFTLTSSMPLFSKVIVYPMPEGETPSPDFKVTVNGTPAPVYQARVSARPENQVWPGHQRYIEQTEIASFCYFDTDQRVTIEIESEKPVDAVVIRPLSKKIKPNVNGRKISFAVNEPGQIVVEVNGYHHALHLFANPIAWPVEKKTAENTLYFGPGVHHPGIIKAKENQHIHIDGGAVVHTIIKVENAENVKITGRGVIDASSFARGSGNAISIVNSHNITVDGLILRDPPSWTLTAFDSHHITINNVKLIGLWRYNADGIDISNSHTVSITNSFVRAFDDCIVLKGLKKGDSKPKNVSDLFVDNCVLWNDWGRAIEIGAETVADSIYHCSFRNIDIVHFVHIAIGIQNGDRAHIFDIHYEDIRIEAPIREGFYLGDPHSPGQVDPFLEKTSGSGVLNHLIWVFLSENPYSKDSIRGKVSDITFKNIRYQAPETPQLTIIGHSREHAVSNITFDNIQINGKKLNAQSPIQMNDFVHDLKFK